jgi:hypothetical protein
LYFARNRDRAVIACGAHDQGNFSKMKKSNLIRSGSLMAGFVFLSSCATAPLTITPINPQGLGAQTQGTRVDTLYAQGRDALMAGDLASALELFHGARRAGPEDVRVLNGLGVIYDRLGRYDLSANYYESARAIDPASTIVQTNLALSTQMRSGRPAPTMTAAREEVPSQDKPSWGGAEAPQEMATAPMQPETPVVEVADYVTPQPQAAAIIYEQQNTPVAAPVRRAIQSPQPVPMPAWTQVRAPVPLRNAPARPQNQRTLPIATANLNRPTWSRSAVIVINSSGVAGRAMRTATNLRQAGWHVSYIGNQRPYTMAATQVTYGPGQRQQALTIARALRQQFGASPTVIARRSASHIQVRLGRDSAVRMSRSRQT